MWNEELGEFQLKYIAYTGNHMRKQTNTETQPKVEFYCEYFLLSSGYKLIQFAGFLRISIKT
jgi:hypothetical protein